MSPSRVVGGIANGPVAGGVVEAELSEGTADGAAWARAASADASPAAPANAAVVARKSRLVLLIARSGKGFLGP